MHYSLILKKNICNKNCKCLLLVCSINMLISELVLKDELKSEHGETWNECQGMWIEGSLHAIDSWIILRILTL
jgi:hypothetical protein